MSKPIPQCVLDAVNSLLAPYGATFTPEHCMAVVSPSKAQELLGGISRATLYRLSMSGKLVPFKITERLSVYRITDINKFLELKAQAGNTSKRAVNEI